MNRILPIIILGVIGFILLSSILTGPEHLQYGAPKPKVSSVHVKSAVQETGALNMVTAIYLNYRVYDTLGEAVVFFAAALGVFMLLKREDSDIE